LAPADPLVFKLRLRAIRGGGAFASGAFLERGLAAQFHVAFPRSL
jgi:hypothetical protein